MALVLRDNYNETKFGTLSNEFRARAVAVQKGTGPITPGSFLDGDREFEFGS